MLNKDLFFRQFDVIAMILDIAVVVGGVVGGGRGCMHVRRWKHSGFGLIKQVASNAAVIVLIVLARSYYCFLLSIVICILCTLPHEIAAICVVDCITEERDMRISFSTIVAFVEEVHTGILFII